MSDPVDERLVRHLSTLTGLRFDGSRGESLRDLLTRAAAREDIAPERLLRRVVEDQRVFFDICDDVTVQESFFFRERSKLELLRHWMVSLPKGHRALRIWSAGCASGEEVYTLAAVAADAGLGGRVEIVGTDLSLGAIETARVGTYGRWALRGLDATMTARLFTVERDRYVVRDEFRASVKFYQHNLLQGLPEHLGQFDVIFCRNLLIYLTDRAVEQAASRLGDALLPGGMLITGAADPMLEGLGGLEFLMTAHGLSYELRDASATPTPSNANVRRSVAQPLTVTSKIKVPLVGEPAIPTATMDSDLVTKLLQEADLALHLARPGAAESIARRVLVVDATLPAAHRIMVQALSQGGLVEEAVEAAAGAVALNPVSAEMNALHAVALLESGRVMAAKEAAHRAVYLDHSQVQGHLLLARAADELDDRAAARRARRNVRRLLALQRESA